jgi:hypothetical protein
MILKVMKVYAQFAAYAGIGLRQQGSWYYHEIDSPFKGGCTEPTHIAQYAPAKYHQAAVSIHVMRRQGIPDFDAGVQVLVSLTASHRYHKVIRKGLHHHRVTMFPGILVNQYAHFAVLPLVEE